MAFRLRLDRLAYTRWLSQRRLRQCQSGGDAERALSNYRLDLDALRLQTTAVASSRRSHERAALRYRAGDITLAELLAEEADLRDAEDAQARVQTAAAIDLVALFKALGGGWSPPPQGSDGQAPGQH